jgi:sodium pump decarboxylase gamma subunit
MELLMQGLVLMVIGMATVFAFLMLLIVSMSTSAVFFRKFSHLFPEEAPAAQKPVAAGDPAAEIAVVLAAIRAKRG